MSTTLADKQLTLLRAAKAVTANWPPDYSTPKLADAIKALLAASNEAEEASKPPTFTVRSSHGELVVDCETGLVVKAARYNPADPESKFITDQIIRFDVGEWLDYHGRLSIKSTDIDILDIGFWGRFEGSIREVEPDGEWRKQFSLSTKEEP